MTGSIAPPLGRCGVVASIMAQAAIERLLPSIPYMRGWEEPPLTGLGRKKMASEMIERVAKALWDLHQSGTYILFASNEMMFGREWYGKVVPWSYVTGPDVVPSCAEQYRDQARAAIEALKEPTEEMKEAGAVACAKTISRTKSANVCYRAMIDAALSSSSEAAAPTTPEPF